MMKKIVIDYIQLIILLVIFIFIAYIGIKTFFDTNTRQNKINQLEHKINGLENEKNVLKKQTDSLLIEIESLKTLKLKQNEIKIPDYRIDNDSLRKLFIRTNSK